MRTHRTEPGIALIAVIAALSALLLIAVPFSLSMRDHRQSATSFAARSEARMGAAGILAHAKARLVRTHESLDETPDWDTQDELVVPLDELPFEVGDPQGILWSVRVQDEQGKIHLGSASPFLLGNVLGTARLAAGVAQEDTTLPVDDPSRFDPAGGLVWVGGELVRYAGAGEGGLKGCERGVQVEWARFLDPVEHPIGAVVLDARAVFLTHLPVVLGRDEGRVAELGSRTAVKRIAELGDAAITPGQMDRLLALSTVHSLALGGLGFGNAQPILDPIALFEEHEDGGRVVQLRSARYANPGTVVEVSDGTERLYTVINRPPRLPNLEPSDRAGRDTVDLAVIGGTQLGNGQIQTQSGTILETDGIEHLITSMIVPPSIRRVSLPLFEVPELDPGEGRTLSVKTRGRHPVNVNTASDEVLRLLVVNLQLAGSQGYVTAPEAEALIERMRREPVRSHRDLLERILIPAVDEGSISEEDLTAVYLNALNANDARLAFATAPFAYKSLNVLSVEATAIVNSAAGVELDRQTVREVVHVSPGEIETWTVDTQEEFEDQIAASRSARSLVTYPNNAARFDPRNDPPSRYAQSRYAGIFPSAYRETAQGEDEGDVRLRPTRTARRANVEHFDAELTHDGLVLEGGVYEAPMIRALETDLGMAAGYVRFWFQLPDGGSDVTLFDAGASVDRNRVHLFYDPGDAALKLHLYDASLPDTSIPGPSASEASHPMTLEPETWYHVTAAWRGTKPGDLTLFVDGIHRSEHRFRTRLTSSLAAGSTASTISVEDAEGFPPRGALLLGDEVLEYESRSDSSFTLYQDPVTGRMRGMRGTAIRDHEAGETVELLGYTDALHSDIRTGGATLGSPLGFFDVGILATDGSSMLDPCRGGGGGGGGPGGGPPPIPAVRSEGTTFNLIQPPLSPNGARFMDAFQDEGYALVIGNASGPEFVQYQKAGATTLTVQRGVTTPWTAARPLPAQTHPATQHCTTVVIPISIQASGTLGLTAYMDPATEFDRTTVRQDERIQIGREWIRYDSIEAGFFLRDRGIPNLRSVVESFASSGWQTDITTEIRNRLDFRAMNGTEELDHAGGEEIRPCFRVVHPGPGRDDVVTILGPGGAPEQATITHAARVGAIAFAALDRNVARVHESMVEPILLGAGQNQNPWDQIRLMDTRTLSRVLKFPSGELPTSVPETLGFGASIEGGGAANLILDEVEVNRMREVPYLVELDGRTNPIGPNERDVPIFRRDGLVGHGTGNASGIQLWPTVEPRFTEFPEDGGIAWAGDELFAYREVDDPGPNADQPYLLRDCVRGIFGTEPGTLREGERVYLLSFLPVTRLASGASETSFEFAIEDGSDLSPQGVFGLIGEGYELDELIGYTGRTRTLLYMPARRRAEDEGGPGEGLFRGRYGTDAFAYSARDLVLEMPFRYWDRAAPESDDPELAYLQLSRSVPGAYFVSIDWDEHLPRSFVDVELLVRIDERVPWNAVPLGRENGLFRFENPEEVEGENAIGMHGDLCEIRVFFEYRPGAFEPTGRAQAWKDTPWLQSIDVRYLTPQVVARREALP